MRNRYDPTPIWALIFVNVLIFILTSSRPDIGNTLAMTKPITDSNYWTIVTAIFVHANITHILFNMITLYFFGTFFLQLVDLKWFLVIYFVGGILGNLLFLLIGPNYSSVVGASGAIFAIGGALAIMRPNQRVYAYFLIPMPLWVAIFGSFIILVFISGVAWQAHLGGLIVGLVAGFYLRQKERQRLKPGQYRIRY